MKNFINKELWIQSQRRVKIPHVLNIKYYPYFKSLNKVLQSHLPKDNKMTVFEIGCAIGSYLIYFHKNFGYRVAGADYTEEGVLIAKKNFACFNIKTSKIYHQDIFSNNIKEQFDVVFSGGFVEHFSDLRLVIDTHIKYLKNKGYLIITVPNFHSRFYRTLQKYLNKKDYHSHQPLSREEIRNNIPNDFDIKYLGYVGPLDFGILQSKNAVINFIIRTVNKAIQLTLYLLRIEMNSANFSPSIVLIAQRK